MLAEHGVDFLAKGGGGTTSDGGNSAMCAAGLNDLLKTLNDDLSVATDELTAAQALSDAIGGQGTTSAEVVGYSVIAEKGLIGKLKGVADVLKTMADHCPAVALQVAAFTPFVVVVLNDVEASETLDELVRRAAGSCSRTPRTSQ